MINSRFYEGFEGKAELSFVAGDNKLVIWNGYFETILDNLLDCSVEKKREFWKNFLIMRAGMMIHRGWLKITLLPLFN